MFSSKFVFRSAKIPKTWNIEKESVLYGNKYRQSKASERSKAFTPSFIAQFANLSKSLAFCHLFGKIFNGAQGRRENYSFFISTVAVLGCEKAPRSFHLPDNFVTLNSKILHDFR